MVSGLPLLSFLVGIGVDLVVLVCVGGVLPPVCY